MTQFGERDFELAQQRSDQEREAGAIAVAARLNRPGAMDCSDCDEPIEPERRAALPSASRCFSCQSDFEKA